jgi:quinol monooxygenase YgiN
MKSYLLEYKLKPGNFDQVCKLIRDFVEQVQIEEGTLLYSPFHYIEENNKFVHVISFENASAEAMHKEAEYTKKFIEQLSQLTINEPKYVEIKYVNYDE